MRRASCGKQTRRKLSKTMIDYIEIEQWAAEYAKQYSGNTSDIELAAIRAATWANDVNGKKMAEFHATIAKLIAENERIKDCFRCLEYDPTPIDWIAALLAEFETHYQPERDDDPDATSEAKSHVRRFIEKAIAATKPA